MAPINGKKSETRNNARGRATRGPKTPWNQYPYVALQATSIAEQSYCEQRVDLWLKDPGERVSIPRKLEQQTPAAIHQAQLADAGRQVHADLSELSEVIRTEDLAAILARGGRQWLVESPSTAEFGGIPIVGIPDAVCFEDGRAVSILEYKLTDSNQLQMSHRVQLLVYGYLLEQSGYDVRELILTCVLIPTAHGDLLGPSADSGVEANLFMAAAAQAVSNRPSLKNWSLLDFPVIPEVCVNLRVFRYDRSRVLKELEFFCEYWSGQRPPKPTAKPGKCACCLYNSIGRCSSALVPYESD